MIKKQILAFGILCFTNFIGYAQLLKPINFADIRTRGELNIRAQKNLDRLESDIYTPEKVFPPREENTAGWPGDYEGRVLVSLIVESQAAHRKPKYLEEMMRMLPQKLNRDGYFGALQSDIIQEQQLSGNSWLLRTLCEYYYWKRDPKMKEYLERVIRNLVLPTKGYHAIYPIDPKERDKTKGAAIGYAEKIIGKWRVSSDIGTDFVFLDGIVQAYGIIPSPELKSIIDEIVARFLEIDLKGMKVQAHATLTGLRGLLRYYSITKQPYLLQAVIQRYNLYRSTSMTADFENFNWFDRPEWTEPCAIVDSYLLAVQLWQYTNKPFYLEDAHHIYYNGIANTQRANGGFGLNNCPRPGYNSLNVNENEAWWCCTMRGGEGLARAIQYSYFIGVKEIVIPFFNNSVATLKLGNQTVTLNQTSVYPFEGKVSFDVLNSSLNSAFTIKVFAPYWTKKHKLTLNGRSIPFVLRNGFLIFKPKLSKGNKIVLTFDQQIKAEHMVNQEYSKPDFYTLNYGPLILGIDNTNKQPEISFTKLPKFTRLTDRDWMAGTNGIHFSTVYQLLDPKVTKESGYSKQILFKIADLK
ncbi:hypothetical protein [Pedobacter sp. WC2423]|uniref:hypothetical protein n=1 Tax=Pedobacter sp. WC2423 TaxID=3234142 RepID=UPI003467D6A8